MMKQYDRFHHSRVAQRKRAGPITQRSVDRNHALLIIFKTYFRFFSNILDPVDFEWSQRASKYIGYHDCLYMQLLWTVWKNEEI